MSFIDIFYKARIFILNSNLNLVVITLLILWFHLEFQILFINNVLKIYLNHWNHVVNLTRTAQIIWSFCDLIFSFKYSSLTSCKKIFNPIESDTDSSTGISWRNENFITQMLHTFHGAKMLTLLSGSIAKHIQSSSMLFIFYQIQMLFLNIA